jgi:Ca2+-binding RTX toxin-like protein
VAIPGATSSTYVLQQADLGATIRAYVTATNVIGSDTLITNHTFPTLPRTKIPPTASVAPTMLGNPLPGLTLSATLGTWSGDAPIKLTIQWQRCDATGGGCKAIKGATKKTLSVTAKFAGSRLRFVVTASNGVGDPVKTFGPITDAIQLIPHKKGRTIRGTRKADYLAGGGFDDTIYGLGGNDTIVGGAGADRILGGAGADVITGGTGRDTIDAGAGSDTIMAADGDRDTVDCGSGSDRTVVDAIDITVNCEAVQISGGTTSTPPPATSTTTTTPTTTSRQS